jgi:hypothetical protein
MNTEVTGDALLSECGTYRYTLGRAISQPIELRLTPTFTLRGEHRPCLFVMLNPSTADATLPDPTITRCMGFAEREGCTQLTVVNLFAFRTAFPKDLVAAHKRGIDVWGPENYTHVQRELRRHNASLGHLIIAAWGAHPMATVGNHHIREALGNVGAMCLGVTKAGEPRHPLYLRSDTPLIPWKPTP